MSLPDLMKANENYGTFQIWDYSIVDDGYGGYVPTYTPGVEFEGVLILNDSIDAQVAQQQGVTGIYNLTVEKALSLPWHTVFKQVSGESVKDTFYRVTTRDENSTPKSTTLNLRVLSAEEFALPKGAING